MTAHWRLDAGGQTLVIASFGGVPQVIHWGARLPEDEDLESLAAAARQDVTGGMLDTNAPLSLTPEPATGFPGQPGRALSAEDGTPLSPRFTFERAEVTERALRLTSVSGDLRLVHEVEAQDASGQFKLVSRIEAQRPVRLGWLAAPVVPGPQAGTEIVDIAGRWIGEFQLQRTPWSPGIRLREARQGRSGHEHPPYLLLPAAGATNSTGEVHALQYAWSGGHRMVAEELPDGRRQIQFGHSWGSQSAPARIFETAPLYLAHSLQGFNGIAVANQRLVRSLVAFPSEGRPRPVHYNCWEAVYMNHRLSELSAIAERAARIGAERFVLDDGWFGRRDDDTSSLGDWTVDRRKWPDGLHPLIARVQDLGMTFGLWVEPEMVSPDSDLYRAHPDWALGPADQPLGRHQMVLDMSLPEVRDHLFDALAALLKEYAIDYLKWDHNRLLPVADAAQTYGTYALIDRLRAAFPAVEIESCASGGGRIDAGILARTHRVWLSDSNDALERLRIQHDAALFLPPEVTGSHVGPRHCHTSGRELSMSFRARVAAQRHLGFEMDLRELTEEEEATLAAVTAWWKEGRGWRMAADVIRLDSADPALVAEMQVSADGKRFTLFAGQAAASLQILPRPLRLSGLAPAARYRVTLLNPEDAAARSRGPVALKRKSLVLSGQALMQAGLMLPCADPCTMLVVEGERL